MRFFDRTEEIASLRKIREMAKNNVNSLVHNNALIERDLEECKANL